MKTLLPHRKTVLFLAGLCFFIMQSAAVNAQKLDLLFRDLVPQERAEINVAVEQKDRKIMVGGDSPFLVSGKPTGSVVRLTSSGAIDRSFSTYITRSVYSIAQHVNGTYLVGVDGALVVLAKNGTPLAEKDIYWVYDILVLPDFSFLVNSDGDIRKFNADFEPDWSFGDDSYLDVDGSVYDMALQGSNIIISGDFDEIDGWDASNIARIDASGNFDDTFEADHGFCDEIGEISIQKDGKILLGGTELNWDGSLIRLNADGTIDESFYTCYLGEVGSVVERNRKIYVYSYDNSTITRLNMDGSNDDRYPGVEFGCDDSPHVMFLGTGDAVAINVTSFGNPLGFAKFSAAGRPASFKPDLTSHGDVWEIERNGSKYVVVGEFIKLNNVQTQNVGLLSANGTVNTRFKSTFDGEIWNAKPFSDGSVLVNDGYFTKLTRNGEYDESFYFNGDYPFWGGWMERFDITPDDKFVVAALYGVGRFNNDGSPDESFAGGNVNNAWNTNTTDVDVQADGKVLYAGYFSQFYQNSGMPDIGGLYPQSLLRLTANGEYDHSFYVGDGPYYSEGSALIFRVIATPDGGSYVLGQFDSWDGFSAPSGIVKLDQSGSVDFDAQNTLNSQTIYPYFYMQNDVVALQNGVALFTNTPALGWGIHRIDEKGNVAADAPIAAGIDFYYEINGLSSDVNSLVVLGPAQLADGKVRTVAKVKYSNVRLVRPEEQEEEVARLSAYPNPTTEFISFDTKELSRVTIFTMDGQVKLQTQVKSSAEKIDVRGLTPGRYVVKMEVGGKIRTEHLIKD